MDVCVGSGLRSSADCVQDQEPVKAAKSQQRVVSHDDDDYDDGDDNCASELY
jgi:hypothetical protein